MMKKHFVPVIILLLVSLGNLYAQSSVVTTDLFDGKTLAGWRVLNPADEKLWTVGDSAIIGGDGHTIIKENSYLYTENEYEDFEFRCLFRLSGDPATGLINSWIQYQIGRPSCR